MQGCDYSRVERFIAAEKPALLPLPRQAFQMKRHAQLKVAPNSFIQLGQERHHYSVPCRLIGMQVEVVFTSTMVRIYHDGQCVATHPRSLRTGAYTYVKEHLPSQSQAYYDYGPQRFIARGASYGRIVELVMRELFSSIDKPAEIYYRSAQGILDLARETEPEIFLLACELAVRYGKCNYPFINNMVKSKCAGYLSQQPDQDSQSDAPSPHGNFRGRQAFY